MRIALFGGSFNPIHRGHLAIADAIVQQHLADEVWLMVSPQNPLKTQDGLLPEQVRLLWAQIAVAEHPHVVASGYEFSMPRPSYTYQTLRRLREERPSDTFILCIGADNWECFPQWRATDEIMAHHDIIVYPRQGSVLPAEMPHGVYVLQCPLVNVSSTEIRTRLTRGESIEGLVPDALISILEEEWKKH